MTDKSEASAFQRMAVEHLPGLYALARHLTDVDADAEDLVQEALVKANGSVLEARHPTSCRRSTSPTSRRTI